MEWDNYASVCYKRIFLAEATVSVGDVIKVSSDWDAEENQRMAQGSDHMFAVAAVPLCAQIDVLSPEQTRTFSSWRFSSLGSFFSWILFYFSNLAPLETQGVCH
jgi:hypothetical protein